MFHWKPPTHNWRKFQGLSWSERGFFFLSLLLLPITAAALRLLGLKRTQLVLLRLAPTLDLPGDAKEPTRKEQALGFARLVRAAATHGPYRANCLKQSLVLWWLLRLSGIPSDLRIGVRKAPAGLEAHAWIECAGRPLNDRQDVPLRFAPFQRAIGPRCTVIT
jgi:hypothetical protein